MEKTPPDMEGSCEYMDHVENRAVDGRVILKWIFEDWDGGMDWIIWLRIETGGGLLKMQ
jgi:hypothetical protein